jgi:SAM-dependent methyltransferase
MSGFRDFLFDRAPSGPHALAVAMTAVWWGERLLLVGDDVKLFAQLAAKTGLTGRNCAVVGSEAAAARAEAAAASGGVLMDVVRGALPTLPVGDGEFDVAVLDTGPTLLSGLDATGRAHLIRSVHRALRVGGRVVIVEGQAPTFFGLVRTRSAGLDAFRSEGGSAKLLEAAGFQPVRILADREGQRFTEGLKAQGLEAR